MSLFYGLLFIFPVWSTENVLKRLPGLSWMENPKSTYEGDSRLACVRSAEDKHVWWLQMLTSMEVNERAEQDSSAYGRQLPLYNQLQGKKHSSLLLPSLFGLNPWEISTEGHNDKQKQTNPEWGTLKRTSTPDADVLFC